MCIIYLLLLLYGVAVVQYSDLLSTFQYIEHKTPCNTWHMELYIAKSDKIEWLDFPKCKNLSYKINPTLQITITYIVSSLLWQKVTL